MAGEGDSRVVDDLAYPRVVGDEGNDLHLYVNRRTSVDFDLSAAS
jgi:hypothetical protein